MTAPNAAGEGAGARKGADRRLRWALLCIAGSAAGFAGLLAMVDLRAMAEAARSLPLTALVAAQALSLGMLFLGAARWQMVLRAYGAVRLPPVLRLAHLHLVGLFYNTFLPGGVGGDLVRGIVSREAFGPEGTTAALTVVLMERVVGLTSLLLVAGTALILAPLPGVQASLPWGLLGLAGAGAAVLGVALARRLSFLPGRPGRLAASLPRLVWAPGLPLGLLLSLAGQATYVLAGYTLLHALAPQVALTDAMVVVPVAMAAAFFPLTVGGAGVREAALVALCTTALGMPAATAAAASLALWGSQVVVAALGGLLQLLLPFQPEGSET